MAMLKTIFLLSCLTALAASAALEEQLSVQFVAKDELKGFLEKNPEAIKLESKENNDTSRSAGQDKRLITYTLGQLQNGDYLIAQGESDQIYSWSESQDVHVGLSYPATGYGKIVKYIEIQVAQSSDSGAAYVSKGGIGQRQISIIVQVYDTYYFGFECNIYGTD